MRYALLILLFAFLLFAFEPLLAQDKAAPDWFAEHVARATAGSGRWIASNDRYLNDQETADEYGIEWHRGINSAQMSGRLFGLIDDEEVGTYWHFFVYWNPAESRAVITQVGAGGAVGTGFLYQVGADGSRAEQTFAGPDGTTSNVGHEEKELSPTRHRSSSFDITADGAWQPRRSYEWVLQE